jgi:hypothetical protein
MIDYETLQIFEEVAKLPRPRTTDTSYVTPDWDNLTSEQIEIIGKIIKQFRND